jgi:hypothetical protein
MCSIGKLEMNDLGFFKDGCKHHESDFLPAYNGAFKHVLGQVLIPRA